MTASDALGAFRASAPIQRLAYGGVHWQYRVTGGGAQGLLLLPGAVGDGDAYFTPGPLLSSTHRLVAISYPPVDSVTGLLDGLRYILDRERVDSTDIVGGSFGGLIAQAFLRRFPQRTRRIVLSATGPAKPARAVSNQQWSRVIGALPIGLSRTLGSGAGLVLFVRDDHRPGLGRRSSTQTRRSSETASRRRRPWQDSAIEIMLTTQHLRKSFGTLVAVDDVSFKVERGTLVGLLGPNGAGKTTTVSMIAGLVAPDKGDVLIEGARLSGDTDPQKRRIGLVPQDLALYDELSARANLRFFGALYSLSGGALDTAIKSAMDLVGLSDRLNDRVATYSGGMKRRLNLAAGLLHDPDVLLLDEPTVGVDPQSRNAIFDNLETLKARGKALLYTTHYMEEVERLADRIVVMDHGKVIAEDTLDGLQWQFAPAGGGKATLESVFLTLTGRSLRD